MKKILLVLFFLGIYSISNAAVVTDGGFEYTPTTKYVSVNRDTASGVIVWTPASGKRIVLTGAIFASDTATTLSLITRSGVTDTTILPVMDNTASGQIVLGNGTPIWQGAADVSLRYVVPTLSRHSITLYGYEK